jgi:hypothetical protein
MFSFIGDENHAEHKRALLLCSAVLLAVALALVLGTETGRFWVDMRLHDLICPIKEGHDHDGSSSMTAGALAALKAMHSDAGQHETNQVRHVGPDGTPLRRYNERLAPAWERYRSDIRARVLLGWHRSISAQPPPMIDEATCLVVE